MSDYPSDIPSPSNSSKPSSSRELPEEGSPNISSATSQALTETPQVTAGPPVSSIPAIIITSPQPSRPPTPESTLQNRLSDRRHRHSSSQPPSRQRTPSPHERPRSQASARQVSPNDNNTDTTNAAMSSASSSPGNTSTAGASGSSNPSYQLPYAPFPYPMPANTRGSGQQQSGGQGK